MTTSDGPMAATQDQRPRWWSWQRLSGLSLRDHAAALNRTHCVKVSHTLLWSFGLPLTDDRRMLPNDDLRRAIALYTNGQVPEDAWPPLSEKPADEDWERKEFLSAGDPA